MFFLLADKTEGGWVVGLIFGAIWLIFSIISAATKKQEDAKRQQVRESLEGSAPRPPAEPEMFQPKVLRSIATPPQAGGRMQPPARSPQSAARAHPQTARFQQPPREVKRQQPKRAPAVRETKRTPPRTAPPPVPTLAVDRSVFHSPVPQSRQEISATEIRAPGGKKPQLSVNAESLGQWLRPATLRQQFMLTEVLQPPLALRADRL